MRLRSIEFAWRTAWMRTIAASLPGPRRAAPPDWGARPYRVLYVRYDAVGDMIIATGVIRAIARAHPTLAVDVLASDRNHEVLRGNPHVGRVLQVPRSGRRDLGHRRMPALMRELRARGYDVVVDGRIDQPRAFTTTPLLMAASRAPYRVGAAADYGRLVYNLPVPSLPKTVSYTERASFLAEPFGVDRAATSFRPELFLTAAERGAAEGAWRDGGDAGGAARPRRLLVNLSTTSVHRRWPDDRFVAVLAQARARRPDLCVRLIALPAELGSAREIASAAGAAVAPTPDVRAALAMVGTADLVFTPDTAISHAAAAFDVPAVVMIPAEGIGYAPCAPRARLVVAEGKALGALAVEPVREAVEWLLAQAPNGERPAYSV